MARADDLTERLLRAIADGEPPPGAALPSVRATAAAERLAPATVARAHAALARAGVVVSEARRASRVAPDGAARARAALRGSRPALRLAGSDDPLLDALAGHEEAGGLERIGGRGSLAGLAALWERRADAAALHVRHRDGRYNAPFAAAVLAGRRPVLVHLWRREQGLLCPPGNPDGLRDAAGLTGRRTALRRPGTGTRVLLERLVAGAGADPAALRGPEVGSHLEAALAVAAGSADAALGLRAAAEALGLAFVPLAWEPFELALPEAMLDAAGGLIDAAARHAAPPGYDVSGAGAVTRPTA